MKREQLFASEAELVAAFCDGIKGRRGADWTAYHETAGWDLLLAHTTGAQIGIEAKLSLNAKVLDQALPGRWSDEAGPDYRAVLVPANGIQLHLERIALHLGITVLTIRDGWVTPQLPDEAYSYGLRSWPNWCPGERCKLPEYIPDVTGGKAAPVALTPWKVKAIKLLILLERYGAVSRRDMKALEISPSRWTDAYHGFLSAGPDGYVRNTRTPDLKAQHPINWGQIEADFQKWGSQLCAGRLPLVAP